MQFLEKDIAFCQGFLHTFLALKADFGHSALVSEADVLILSPQKLSFRKIVTEFSPSFLHLSLPPLLPSSLYFFSFFCHLTKWKEY